MKKKILISLLTVSFLNYVGCYSYSTITSEDIENEKLRIERALESLQENGSVELTWLQGQAWRDIQRTMRTGSWNIFHNY